MFRPPSARRPATGRGSSRPSAGRARAARRALGVSAARRPQDARRRGRGRGGGRARARVGARVAAHIAPAEHIGSSVIRDRCSSTLCLREAFRCVCQGPLSGGDPRTSWSLGGDANFVEAGSSVASYSRRSPPQQRRRPGSAMAVSVSTHHVDGAKSCPGPCPEAPTRQWPSPDTELGLWTLRNQPKFEHSRDFSAVGAWQHPQLKVGGFTRQSNSLLLDFYSVA